MFSSLNRKDLDLAFGQRYACEELVLAPEA